MIPVRRLLPALLVLLLLLPRAGFALAPDEVERRVEGLLGRMSLDEKVGQLNLVPNSPSFDRAEVVGGHVGGVMAFANGPAILDVQRAARSSRLGIPLLVGLDVLHGLRTMFPLGLAEAASFDPAHARLAAEIAAREAAALGFNWTFAPMADLSRDPRWGRMIEGFGEDPLLGRLFTRARVEGFRVGGLAVTLKHFAGYGAAEGGRDYDAADISGGHLHDSYLPPFRAGIEAGAESVMSAFHALNGVPATASRELLTGVLRDRLGFDGMVVSDWSAIEQLIEHGVAAGPDEAATKAIKAGTDMDMASGLYRRHLAGAVRSGRIPEAVVTEAARRVLRVKVRAGLLERPLPDTLPHGPAPPTADARAAARRIAADTIVLLRNDGRLPLGPASGRLAVIGAMAATNKDVLGPHEALVRWDDTVTILDGLRVRAARAGLALTYAAGCDVGCAGDDGFPAATEAARAADIVVAVLGEPLDLTGEAGSRATLTLPGRGAALLDALVATGKPVVLLLVAGRPIELGPVVDRLAGLAMAWFPGTEGGNAVADILFGDVEPNGRLPISWPRRVGQVPVHYDRMSTGRPFDPKNRFTLRYVDEELSPLFPFGFGLSYSRFALSGLVLADTSLARDGTLAAQVTLTNTGHRPGREVVQLYTRQRVGSRSRPVRQLRAFEKVTLAPGDSRAVSFRVPVAELGFHRDDGSYVVEPSPFDAAVGLSSDTTLSARFEILE